MNRIINTLAILLISTSCSIFANDATSDMPIPADVLETEIFGEGQLYEIKQNAHEGNVDAMRFLVGYYADESSEHFDKVQFISWLDKLAAAGNSQAQYDFANIMKAAPNRYLRQKSIWYLIQSADQQHVLAALTAAKNYTYGTHGFPKNIDKAQRYIDSALSAANKQKFTPALGEIQQQKKIIAQQQKTEKSNKPPFSIPAKSLTLKVKAVEPKEIARLTKLADNGDNHAAAILARYYLQGRIESDSFAKDPIPYYNKAYEYGLQAADAGDPAAQTLLGDMFSRATVTLEADHQQAMKWYQQAAKQGNAEALTELANYAFYAGEDAKKVESMYQQAADSGELSSLIGLQNFYFSSGQKQGQELNHRVHDLAVKSKDDKSLPERNRDHAKSALADDYIEAGEYDKAFDLLNSAAVHGDMGALNRLAHLLKSACDSHPGAAEQVRYLLGFNNIYDDSKGFSYLELQDNCFTISPEAGLTQLKIIAAGHEPLAEYLLSEHYASYYQPDYDLAMQYLNRAEKHLSNRIAPPWLPKRIKQAQRELLRHIKITTEVSS